MKPGASAAFLRDTQALFVAGTVAGLEDEQLLARFSSGLDVIAELAFSALVTRHGPMVLATCRRALGDWDQADDAFQATFLVLAKRARSVRGQSLGPWLYGVARKVCQKARSDRVRRAQRQAQPVVRMEIASSSSIDPTDLAHQSELRDLIDRELARIPARLREAIVLCDLQGLSHDEAARHLGCPTGTIKSRQARGRARLRERLARLGLDPSAVASPAAIVSARLASATASAARSFQFGGLIQAGVGPASVALSLSTLRELSMIHLFKITAAAAAGLGTLAMAAVVQEPATPSPAAVPASAAAVAEPQPRPVPSSLPAEHAVSGLKTTTSRAEPAVDPQNDRLRSLEDKLDRVLGALEKSLHREPSPTARTPSPSVPFTFPNDLDSPFVVPGQTAAPALPRQTTPRANRSRAAAAPQPNPATPPASIESRLIALEERVNTIESELQRRIEQLEKVTQSLSIRVLGEAPATQSTSPVQTWLRQDLQPGFGSPTPAAGRRGSPSRPR